VLLAGDGHDRLDLVRRSGLQSPEAVDPDSPPLFASVLPGVAIPWRRSDVNLFSCPRRVFGWQGMEPRQFFVDRLVSRDVGTANLGMECIEIALQQSGVQL